MGRAQGMAWVDVHQYRRKRCWVVASVVAYPVLLSHISISRPVIASPTSRPRLPLMVTILDVGGWALSPVSVRGIVGTGGRGNHLPRRSDGF